MFTILHFEGSAEDLRGQEGRIASNFRKAGLPDAAHIETVGDVVRVSIESHDAAHTQLAHTLASQLKLRKVFTPQGTDAEGKP